MIDNSYALKTSTTTKQDNFVPAVSIIVPVYNREKYLVRCIDSILKQTFAKFELILVDDGSDDMSGAICRSYAEIDHRVQYIYQENAGVSAARNKGLDVARGEFVAFIDSDDYIEPDMLQMLFVATQNNYSDLACCSYQIVSVQDASIVQKVFPAIVVKSSKQLAKLCYETREKYEIHAPIWGKLYRRSIINDYNLSFLQNISLGEDRIFNFAYFEKIRSAILIEYVGYNYIKHDDYSLTNVHTQKAWADSLFAITREKNYFESKVDSFDIVEFSNSNVISIAYSLRMISNDSRSYSEMTYTIKLLLLDAVFANLIKTSRIKLGISLNKLAYLFAMKTRSPFLIFSVFSMINLLHPIWRKMKILKCRIGK